MAWICLFYFYRVVFIISYGHVIWLVQSRPLAFTSVMTVERERQRDQAGLLRVSFLCGNFSRHKWRRQEESAGCTGENLRLEILPKEDGGWLNFILGEDLKNFSSAHFTDFGSYQMGFATTDIERWSCAMRVQVNWK